ncbi:Uncharacterized protein APZ42_030163 [Daphnia magna]|uniref:Uncharacterized protein n=1 Tax=Daphnia magna TaxID=35525 RepID=A0A164P087_9CRUS|nr:Uncharacterized protein APZ42_030163 [Daphnia magna]
MAQLLAVSVDQNKNTQPWPVAHRRIPQALGIFSHNFPTTLAPTKPASPSPAKLIPALTAVSRPGLVTRLATPGVSLPSVAKAVVTSHVAPVVTLKAAPVTGPPTNNPPAPAPNTAVALVAAS